MGRDLSLLTPAAALICWTLIMLLWMAAARAPVLAKLGEQLKNGPPGGRGIDLEPMLPPSTNWKSHNYTHLLEQPTLFYAVVLILFVGGGTTALTVALAWGYTAIRIVHSLWQATVNRVPLRLMLFLHRPPA